MLAKIHIQWLLQGDLQCPCRREEEEEEDINTVEIEIWNFWKSMKFNENVKILRSFLNFLKIKLKFLKFFIFFYDLLIFIRIQIPYKNFIFSKISKFHQKISKLMKNFTKNDKFHEKIMRTSTPRPGISNASAASVRPAAAPGSPRTRSPPWSQELNFN